MKLIRDPIHGYIEISDKMNKIISDPYFQRLRYIKQTAMAYMVYPSMLHSRFEHSLGVMHLAREFARYVISNSGLKDEEGLIQMIALTGLLHDIGHVAFSHTFENFLLLANQVYGLKVKEEGKKTHVNYGTYLIENVLGSIIDKEFTEFYPDPVKFIIDVLKESPRNYEEKLALSLISNYVDADRSDYLLRDSYYAGVSYGRFDIERLKRFLVFIDGKLAIYSKATPIVEQFLLSRMYMFENVYFHSVTGVYNAILSHAMVEMLEKNIISLPTEPKDFLQLLDIEIYSNLDKVKEEFKNAIMFRQGYKRIKYDITGKCLEKFNEIKDEIYEDMKESQGLFLYHEFNDVPYEEKEEAVYIFDGERVEKLTSVSPIIRSLSEIKKAVIAYSSKAEKVAEKYENVIQECKTLGP
ncbi:HD domain-containing protein [Acidianus ambivalens]|jgi:hypothetical protein|uniref:HD domain-containing protein n=2 Tax=Acidianus TaxID=12914 RepID=A0A650CTF2_ACIAM|nr:HD domain-containing protein [Acidianus ambivalens]MQL55472.1 HD domain-containing protein [Acidianus ambivalens]PVU74061.1 phosphohydrolase [Acidianus hospitalis]QGR21005.1 HD domain-containing protein [Acidianus ambivalens]